MFIFLAVSYELWVMSYTLNKTQSGLTLIELIVAISIFAIAGTSIYGLFNWSIKTLTNSKQEVAAMTIAGHQMEMIRNLPYDQVGTIGGIPSGSIPQTQTKRQNNTDYTVKTYVKYYDDPFDGLASDSDALPTDYKIVQITVSWTNFWGQNSTNLSTIIAPKGIETDAGGGTLTITVFDANGLPVENADVYIENNTSNPFVSINTFTDSYGRVNFPGAPAASDYKIIVSKSGYSTDRTCASDPSGSGCSDSEGNPNPTKPNATVLVGQVTEISFAIDLLSTVNIKTLNQNFPTAALVNQYTTGEQDNPAFVMDSAGNYYFAWRDGRGGQQRIYAQKYDSSYTEQWGANDLQVSTSNNQNNPSIAVDSSGYVYIAWVDDRDAGNMDMYLTKLTPAGATVFNDKKISTQNNSSLQTSPQIAVTGDNNYIYVVWQDDINDGGDIYLQKINASNGSNVWTTEKKVNSGSGTSQESAPQLQITTDDNYIYVVWQDGRNGNEDIRLQKFDSSGNKITSGQWPGDVLVNDDGTSEDQLNPKITLSGDNNYIYVVWQDGRGTDEDIYWQKFDTDGNKATDNNWAGGNLIVNQYQTGAQTEPSIAVDASGDIFISWTDARNNGDIYLQKFDTGGGRLWSNDIKINSDNTNTTQANSVLAVKPTNNKAIIAWQDDIMGDNNIYAASFLAPITVNLGNVDFNMRGEKTIGDNPVIYKYNNNHTTDSGGNLTLSGIEWDAYNFTISPSSGLVLLTTDMPLPLNVNPNETVSINLYLKSDTGHSYLVIVKNESGTAIENAPVHLSNAGQSYDKIISTNSQGQSFFTSLANDTYDLEISASGYTTITDTVNINGEVIEERVLQAE
jgi:prepilin-type N-terminal cleavage/methylation domain-containing protein